MRGCEQPNYTAILMELQKDDSTIGLGKVNWRSYTNLNDAKDNLIELFNSHYALREIGAETLMRWKIILQKRFDDIARKYEHAFDVVNKNIEKMDDLARTIEVKSEYGKTLNRINNKKYGMTDKVTYQDTPVTPLSTENDYASSITDDVKGGEDEDTTDDTYGGEDTVTTHDNTEMYIKEINVLIDEYNDISLKFVEEFESCFMSTIMRV